MTVYIFCNGIKTHARYSSVVDYWVCAMCGKRVKVVW